MSQNGNGSSSDGTGVEHGLTPELTPPPQAKHQKESKPRPDFQVGMDVASGPLIALRVRYPSSHPWFKSPNDPVSPAQDHTAVTQADWLGLGSKPANTTYLTCRACLTR
jgi:hypothetical protein